jgi:CBS-domain-containing membrane protein
MQQHNTEYILIAVNGALEGIVSKSDIKSTISPYLRPALAKWRQPADDATLQIKIKWIMTRPLRTINLQTPLTAIMENMCRFAVRCLPVVNQRGKVNGLVTSIDVCKVLLKLKDKLNTSAPAKIAQNNHRLWSLLASSEAKNEHIIPILDVPASSKEKKLLTVSL